MIWIKVLIFVGLYALALVGMFSHFLKKVEKGETSTDIRNYFRDHFLNTLQSFISTTIAFLAYYLTLKTGMVADVIVVFGLGYMCDSFLNRFAGPPEKNYAAPLNDSNDGLKVTLNQQHTPEVKQ
jgi:hypothetical protein